MFTLATGVTGLGELQSETSNRDPCSSLGTESAWPIWGVPPLPTCALALPRAIRSARGVGWSPGGDFIFGLPRPGLGRWEAARVRWRFGSCAHRVVVVDRVVVVGHDQAMSRLIRSRFAVLGTSHRFRARLVCIKWEREIFAWLFRLPDWHAIS